MPTTLPGPVEQVVQMTSFNSTNQLYLLASDLVLFGKLDNLDVKAYDLFGKYLPTSGLLQATKLGQRYNTACCYEVRILQKSS
jgi:hypothetical protein